MPTLDWLHRDAAFRIADAVPYRTLDPVSAHGDGSAHNLLVHGDNLQALKALLPLYRAQVKCIFIDPPYNTKSAFEHYDDNLEHSQWLSMMLPQLQLRREFLREDGSLWVHLDDNEAHYNKVLLDEVFGRRNFIADVCWQKSYAVRSNAEFISTSVEHIVVFAKSRSSLSLGTFGRSAEQLARFENPDDDPRGPWQSVTMTISLMSGARGRQFAKTGQSANVYRVVSPAGVPFDPPARRCWSRAPAEFDRLNAEGRIWWGRDGKSPPRMKMFLSESDDSVIPTTLWASGEVFGFNQDGIRELRAIGLEFPTPKPERLLMQGLHLATRPGDLVLDSFLGSGTTAAVAHKMGRRWIGVERGEHVVTHCLPRLLKVVEGEQGGISAAVGWQGGGGFRFARLGEPVFDAEGRIDPRVRFAALAAFVWQQATRTAFTPAELGGLAGARPGTPQLGVHEGTAVLLLYNGILGDRRPEGGNVLNLAVLQALKRACPHDGPRIVFGEACTLGPARLAAERIEFRQIPYELAAR
jgi:adenine-specific DNA-methyltransferase